MKIIFPSRFPSNPLHWIHTIFIHNVDWIDSLLSINLIDSYVHNTRASACTRTQYEMWAPEKEKQEQEQKRDVFRYGSCNRHSSLLSDKKTWATNVRLTTTAATITTTSMPITLYRSRKMCWKFNRIEVLNGKKCRVKYAESLSVSDRINTARVSFPVFH